MTKKRLFRGMGALILFCVLVPAGCGGVIDPEEDGYTFKFRVDNNTDYNGSAGKTITKVEFINGNTRNDDVLGWSGETLAPDGPRSRQHTVWGFTIERTSGARIFGVQVAFDDNSKVFAWNDAGHNEKILVEVYPAGYYNSSYHSSPWIRFSSGNW
jgi:hypothetical protein